MERLPGFRDFYPEPLPHQDVWSADLRNHIFDTWRRVARRYGFREYDGPPLEPLELYTAKSGDEIVRQLYNFTDKGDRAVALRPEMTPTLARMVAAHSRHYQKPIKWFAIPQLFRYERQQKGRLREHFQFNADIFGEADPAADAELIALAIDSLRALNLSADDFVIRLSSRNAWREFFQRGTRNAEHGTETPEPGPQTPVPRAQTPEPGARTPGPNSQAFGPAEYGFYQIIDKLDREDPIQSDAKLKALGFSLEEVRAFIAAAKPTVELDAILKNLAARGLGDFVKIDYNVIRGLAYYTGVVFEAFDKKGDFRAIAGGGRYDNLVKLISGGKVDLPGLGFGMGDVVLAELLKSRGRVPQRADRLDAYCLIEDESLRDSSLKLVHDLRAAGLTVDYSFTPAKPDKQFKRAVELNVAYTVRLERVDRNGPVVMIKNLGTREESVVNASDAAAHLLAAIR